MRSLARTAIVLLAVPFSLVGSFWLLWLLNYNLSTAVWVGLIALAGLDARRGSSCFSILTWPTGSGGRRAPEDGSRT